MKIMKVALAMLILVAAAYPQTKDLGMGAFSSEGHPILMAVDASLVNKSTGNPYAMFVLFMAAKDKNAQISVAAKDIVMVYKGEEYRMPSLSALRESYNGVIRDLDFYRHLGKEGLIASWVRFYEFPEPANFFPPAHAAVDPGRDRGAYGRLQRLHDAHLFQESRFRQGRQADDQGQGRQRPQDRGRMRGRAGLTSEGRRRNSTRSAADVKGRRQAPPEQT